jgi:sensor histidine kinase YesM
MRFKERFEYSIEIDPEINQISTFIPPFIIQPFIENSIWHGLMNREGNGLLKIRLSYKNNAISCLVEDNGIGRKKSEEIQENSHLNRPSKGIAITETRLKLFDTKKAQTSPINYTDLYDENGVATGTRVEIIIPIVV